jgi:tetratricopeptide (TPR) repeat protein
MAAKRMPQIARLVLGAFLASCLASIPWATGTPVTVCEKDTVIPTYLAGAPEKSPMFYFGRQSQGAEGRVYPYPLYDTLTGKKVDKTYKLVYLENEYVKIGILPEIGGRIFEAVDKTNNYDFFYHQHAIKPALIGLLGAWISGGVEWNIPHHHRASTFLPVQYRIEEGDDGSKTVWVGELELRHRMRWAVGYTLYPGKSYLEAKIRIVNRTPVVQTMLCFANAAVHVNKDYQVIFPPGTQYVTHHHKREFTTWPIATTRYGGFDFRPGTDVSWYKNHMAANSMFAWNYRDDFFAGYDHGKKAGTMSVADHGIVPGKKLWTWGNGPRGRMWDKILTDNDGPYIELMVGAYSDNQPDSSWLQPFEVKAFSMYWYPFREIGGVKKANLDAAVNLDLSEKGKARLGFCTTARFPVQTVRLQAKDRVLLEKNVNIDPSRPFLQDMTLPEGVDPADLRASLTSLHKELIAYTPVKPKPEPMPKPDRFPPPITELKTNEELYLAGLKVEQFHDPNLDPDPFWEEALKRDSGDARVNTVLAIRKLKQARYAEAEAHLRKAIERLTLGYAAPKDGEPFYYLGLALKGQGRLDEATEAFHKSTWSLAWRAAGYYELAEIATAQHDFHLALDLVDRSLEANSLNIRALNLKVAALRHTEARFGGKFVRLNLFGPSRLAAHQADPLDVRALAEEWLATTMEPKLAQDLVSTMSAHPGTAKETAAEYLDAGLWADGLAVLSVLIEQAPHKARISPMVYYNMAYFADKLGEKDKAAAFRKTAQTLSPDYVFPFQDESINVLRAAMEADPRDARAPYYLGNRLFDWQPDEAVKLWEKSVAVDPALGMAHRNLSIAFSQRPSGNDLTRAIAEQEKAVALPSPSPIFFRELDDLYLAAGTPPETRLALLEKYHDLVAKHAEALSREITLLVFAGRYDEAIQRMTRRRFEVWEGGRLTVVGDWKTAHLLRGRQHLLAGRSSEEIADFKAAEHVPDNLPSDEGAGEDFKAEIAYLTGVAYDAQGDHEQAVKSWKAAAEAAGAEIPTGRRWGSSGSVIDRSFKALALRKLGQVKEAETIFRGLTEASQRRTTPSQIDASASVSAQRAQRDRTAQSHFSAGLGHLGLGEGDKAQQELNECLKISPDHLGAKMALDSLSRRQ